MRRPIVLLWGLALTATGCATLYPAAESPVAVGPDPAMRPDLIVVEPEAATPGQLVGLTFPAETTRGIAFVLEHLGRNGWQPRFYLTSDGPGAGWEPSWHPAGGPALAVEDIGVGGSGPDHVPIPEAAEPGTYRICTVNTGDELCAPIEIVAP